MDQRYPSGMLPLSVMDREVLGPEFTAALYESWVADMEAFNTWPTDSVPDAYMVMDRYAQSAQRVADGIESDVVHKIMGVWG